jgi:uncharacterized protein (DUF934 family)
MTILVTDKGFTADTWDQGYTPFGEAANDVVSIDVPADTNPADIEITPTLKMVRIDFPSFADGRGFTIARMLRLAGYTGRLRAYGHVISDQYAMARRTGFDEVEIHQDLAARQPQDQWKFRADWKDNDYQDRMRG